MAKKKTSSTTTTNGQKYRKESKEERKARLKEQEEARQVSDHCDRKAVSRIMTDLSLTIISRLVSRCFL